MRNAHKSHKCTNCNGKGSGKVNRNLYSRPDHHQMLINQFFRLVDPIITSSFREID